MTERDGATDERSAATKRALRFDLVIALCALLISSAASAASWWQARLLGDQTRVLQAQLGAQVWPYVSASENHDGATTSFAIVNDGLGPAILESIVATVDGVPKSSMVDVLHGVLGPHLVKALPHGERMRLAVSGASPGSVLRAGDTLTLLAITNKRYARPLLVASKRIDFRVCYCAIVPDQCWLSDTGKSKAPQSLLTCREVPNDILHASPVDELNGTY